MFQTAVVKLASVMIYTLVDRVPSNDIYIYIFAELFLCSEVETMPASPWPTTSDGPPHLKGINITLLEGLSLSGTGGDIL